MWQSRRYQIFQPMTLEPKVEGITFVRNVSNHPPNNKTVIINITAVSTSDLVLYYRHNYFSADPDFKLSPWNEHSLFDFRVFVRSAKRVYWRRFGWGIVIHITSEDERHTEFETPSVTSLRKWCKNPQKSKNSILPLYSCFIHTTTTHWNSRAHLCQYMLRCVCVQGVCPCACHAGLSGFRLSYEPAQDEQKLILALQHFHEKDVSTLSTEINVPRFGLGIPILFRICQGCLCYETAGCSISGRVIVCPYLQADCQHRPTPCLQKSLHNGQCLSCALFRAYMWEIESGACRVWRDDRHS
jgi:hypothetical protein